MKKIIYILMLSLVLLCAGCQKNNQLTVRYLNFKPEIANVYKKIAQEYQQETGVKVEIETAASGTYESTLQARMGTNKAPTIFQINGPIGYLGWKDYCLDLKDTDLYDKLLDKELAIKSGDGIYGIPNVLEGYGIIYNNEIMKKYFNASWKSTDFMSVSEINSFDKLKMVVEDMQNNKDKLGINGVFAATSLKSGEDWRWQTHLFNVILNAEISSSTRNNFENYMNLEFKSIEKYKNIFDLYIDNSTKEKTSLGTVTVSDSMAEFALGKCAMVQNGNWAASQVLGTSGNIVKSEDIKFMPIYMGLENEENQGICIGTENYLSINKNATKEEQDASIEFLEWLYLSEKGSKFVKEDLKFISPFMKYEDEEISDPLTLEVIKWASNSDYNNVEWDFTIIPSIAFKEDFGANLLKYSQSKAEWNDVVENMKNKWKTEWGLLTKK